MEKIDIKLELTLSPTCPNIEVRCSVRIIYMETKETTFIEPKWDSGDFCYRRIS